jgi:ABC-type antimicrobial peptide transport system permease subunit
VPSGKGFDTHYAAIVVKADRDAASIAPRLRSLVQELQPAATLDRMGPLAAKVSDSAREPRFALFVLGAFAVLALTLATTGLYGVLSYSVMQRRRELGVRGALGASRGDLVAMVLREGLSLTAIGLAIGVAASAGLARAMASLLFGVQPLDGVAFFMAPLLLVVTACAACLIPAARAARVDPAEALRAE